ncbi:MAG: hypothetical protein ACI37Q_04505 [Candidatus Gastranaerophilaceae bacterium]
MSKVGQVVGNYAQANVDFVNAAGKFAFTPFRLFNPKAPERAREVAKTGLKLLETHPLNPNAWRA